MRLPTSKTVVLSSVALLFVIAGVAPILRMFYDSLFSQQHFSIQTYLTVFRSSHHWTLLGNSFSLALLVTLFTHIFGVPLGFLFGKTDFPIKTIFVSLFAIPLLVPSYILAFSWFYILGDLPFFSGLWGSVFVLSSIFLPIPLLFTLVFINSINPNLEEAALIVTNRRNVIRHITLPILFPGLLLSMLFVFLLTFEEFSVPSFLRYDVFPVESFIQFSAFYDFDTATASAFPMVFVALFVLFIEAYFLRERTYRLAASVQRRALVFRLGSWRIPGFLGVFLLVIVIVLLPLFLLVFQSGRIENYVIAWLSASDSLMRSLLFSSVGATVLVGFGFLIGYLIQKRSLFFWRAIDTLTVFLFALPGTVLGIGLIRLWNTPATNFIYATPLILLFAFLAKYLVLTSRLNVIQFSRLSDSLEEAAQIAGATWVQRIRYIIAPMSRRSLWGAWILAYIFILRDTGVTMLVYPPGNDTLPVQIFTRMANGRPEEIAAMCVIMIMTALVPIGGMVFFYSKVVKVQHEQN